MKYYRITLRQNEGDSRIIYPDRYQQEIGNFAQDHLYYNDQDGSSKLLLCIPDKYTNIVRGLVEEISKSEALLISQEHETKTEEINDEAKIRRIEIKSRIGLPLTASELKAIDPNDPTPGFVMKEILADRIEKMK